MEKNNIGLETYNSGLKKPDLMTGYLLIVAVILLLWGIGYKNTIIGFIGVMCCVFAILKYIKRYVK